MQQSHELYIEETDGVYETYLFGFTDEEAAEIATESAKDAQDMELWNGETRIGVLSNQVEDESTNA